MTPFIEQLFKSFDEYINAKIADAVKIAFDQPELKTADMKAALIELIKNDDDIDIVLGDKLTEVTENYDFDEKIGSACDNFDFDDKIKDATDEGDIKDQVREIISNLDFTIRVN